MVVSIRLRIESIKQLQFLSCLNYLLRCTFAHSVHFTSLIQISECRSFIGRIEWKKVDFLNAGPRLRKKERIQAIRIMIHEKREMHRMSGFGEPN